MKKNKFFSFIILAVASCVLIAALPQSAYAGKKKALVRDLEAAQRADARQAQLEKRLAEVFRKIQSNFKLYRAAHMLSMKAYDSYTDVDGKLNRLYADLEKQLRYPDVAKLTALRKSIRTLEAQKDGYNAEIIRLEEKMLTLVGQKEELRNEAIRINSQLRGM